MTARLEWGEESPVYAYGPATRIQRARWRWAMAVVAALRPLLRVLAIGLHALPCDVVGGAGD